MGNHSHPTKSGQQSEADLARSKGNRGREALGERVDEPRGISLESSLNVGAVVVG